MSKLTIQVENFKPLRSNTLFGFVDVLIPQLHLRIREVTVHDSHGRKWIGLPAKPQITRDGQARRDEHGKIAYSSIIQFTDRGTSNAFAQRVIEELLAAYPNAFGDEAAA